LLLDDFIFARGDQENVSLGKGSFAVVLLAYHKILQKAFAIKIMKFDI